VDDSVRVSKFKFLIKVTRQIGARKFKILKLSKCNKLIQWYIFWKIFTECLLLEDSTNTNCTASLSLMCILLKRCCTRKKMRLRKIFGIWQFTIRGYIKTMCCKTYVYYKNINTYYKISYTYYKYYIHIVFTYYTYYIIYIIYVLHSIHIIHILYIIHTLNILYNTNVFYLHR